VNGPEFKPADGGGSADRSAAPKPAELSLAGTIRKNSFGIEMVYVPSGQFNRGSANSRTSQPVRTVSIREGFWIGKYEVTQGQWRSVMGKNPSVFQSCGDTCPVESVSWNDALKFIKKLNDADDGFEYSLPSESEWEYAAAGDGQGEAAASEANAWYGANSGGRTHPVGEKAANSFGLYDVVGNVAEWVQDVFSADYNGLPTDGSANEHIGNTAYRVFRGGSFQDEASVANPRSRIADSPADGYRYNGLRIIARPRKK
jgi:formylglycine-generating enzyme required for sulfatase activity